MDKAIQTAWRQGDALEAGRLLYAQLDGARRPSWALAVLDACASVVSKLPAEVEAVRQIALTPARWSEAHAAFQTVRMLVLAHERHSPDAPSIDHGILYLAENVAKVTYNASGATAPFDDDAGWWVAKNARWIIDRSTDPTLEARVWTALMTR